MMSGVTIKLKGDVLTRCPPGPGDPLGPSKPRGPCVGKKHRLRKIIPKHIVINFHLHLKIGRR